MGLDLLSNLLAPYTGGGGTSMGGPSPLMSLAMSVASSAGSPSTVGGGGGGGGDLGGAPLPGNAFNFDQWAEQYTGPGLDADQLVALRQGSYPMTNGALYVRPDVAAAFKTASRAFHQDTGDWLKQYLVSAWRPFQSSSPKATDLRTSDHWLAGAIDLSAGSAADMWMRQHGGQYGFGNQAAGYHWDDPGHFSFTAGGFLGSGGASGSSWGDPTTADQRWIQLARQLFG